ncbi:uncharacterized protein FFE2_06244 [Fusarium fujikuroi]|nr:uncharacterized protein FFE2_06244 [Fusarium fujikuroi]
MAVHVTLFLSSLQGVYRNYSDSRSPSRAERGSEPRTSNELVTALQQHSTALRVRERRATDPFPIKAGLATGALLANAARKLYI